MNHSTKGTETVNAINNLALITGNIGRAGAAPFSITGQCNAMGTREAGFASSLPGYRKFESAADRDELARAVEHRRSSAFPRRAAWPIPTSSKRRSRGKIRALWIIATNPIVSFPNLASLQQALEGLEFLVVQDGYPSDADDRAAPTWCCRPRSGARRKGPTPTPSAASARSTARSSRRARRAPTSTSFSSSPTSSAVRDELFPGWTTPARRVRGMEARLGRPPLRLLGHDLRALEQHGGMQWPFPEGATTRGVTRRLYADGVFQTEDGRAQLILHRSGSRFPSSRTTSFRSC